MAKPGIAPHLGCGDRRFESGRPFFWAMWFFWDRQERDYLRRRGWPRLGRRPYVRGKGRPSSGGPNAGEARGGRLEDRRRGRDRAFALCWMPSTSRPSTLTWRPWQSRRAASTSPSIYLAGRRAGNAAARHGRRGLSETDPDGRALELHHRSRRRSKDGGARLGRDSDGHERVRRRAQALSCSAWEARGRRMPRAVVHALPRRRGGSARRARGRPVDRRRLLCGPDGGPVDAERGQHWQFADTAAFVASDRGSGITGSIINVSSGVSAH